MSHFIPGTTSISNINNNVGINTLTPQYTLDINGTLNCSSTGIFNNGIYVSSLEFPINSGVSINNIRNLNIIPANIMAYDNNNNEIYLYTGTNYGPTGPQGAQGIVGPQGAQGIVGPVGGVNNQILFNNNNIATGSSNLTYDYNNNEFHLSGTGYTHSLIPASNNTYSLGSPDSLWSDLYVSTGSIHIGECVISSNNSSLFINSNILPTTSGQYLGSLAAPWESIYVSTGSIFIGPNSILNLAADGVIGASNGLATDILYVGGINGINLYTLEDKLFYMNNIGASGPVSVFNVSSNSVNNYYFTGGYLGLSTSNPEYLLDVNGLVILRRL